jgi:hypothetical protein
LPSKYKFDRASGRVEGVFINYNHANVSFEGIRAQDILPLLLERFHFSMFAGYACIVIPFIDRRFGWNFSVENDYDREFIDRVAERDEWLLRQGLLKPTQMLACLQKAKVDVPVYLDNLSPESALRKP